MRNAAYCGYVSARRDTSKAIRGLHEPIVEEALFDRVQELRAQRARTHKPGRPSNRYVLRGLARCERCQGKMHGTAVGRKLSARYYCATRRASAGGCDQPVVHADKVEEQLIAFLSGVQAGAALIDEILDRLSTTDDDHGGGARERRALDQRLRRIRDLYELGDLERADYLSRRDALNAKLDQLTPARSPTWAKPDKS